MQLFTYPENIPGDKAFIICGSQASILILYQILQAAELKPYLDDDQTTMSLDHEINGSQYQRILNFILSILVFFKHEYGIVGEWVNERLSSSQSFLTFLFSH